MSVYDARLCQLMMPGYISLRCQVISVYDPRLRRSIDEARLYQFMMPGYVSL